jgi:hypothetical protein
MHSRDRSVINMSMLCLHPASVCDNLSSRNKPTVLSTQLQLHNNKDTITDHVQPLYRLSIPGEATRKKQARQQATPTLPTPTSSPRTVPSVVVVRQLQQQQR